MSVNPKKGKKPKYQNTYAFKHNKNSKTTKKILALPNEGLCRRCTDIIEWKKKYRKYKPLTVPARCLECHEKNVKRAYHNLCDKCCTSLNVCAKCKDPRVYIEIQSPAQIREAEKEREYKLSLLTERERRKFFRLERKSVKLGLQMPEIPETSGKKDGEEDFESSEEESDSDFDGDVDNFDEDEEEEEEEDE